MVSCLVASQNTSCPRLAILIVAIFQGTRFNATKDQVGTYYTTKIWQFSMKCPSCSTVLIIRTDPKNTDYEYVEGIRKKEMAFDPEEAQTERVQDSEVSKRLAGEDEHRTHRF